MQDDIAGQIVKGGETILTLELGRSKLNEGLLLKVKAAPQIEAFMRSLGGGDSFNTILGGRYWEPIGTTPLRVYNAIHNLPPSTIYTLTQHGRPLIPDLKTDQVNLSFLRLVGISEPEGISFVVKGVYSKDLIYRIYTKVTEATTELYKQFLKPVNHTAILISEQR